MYTKKDYAIVLVSVAVVVGLIFILKANKDKGEEITIEDSVVEIVDSSSSNTAPAGVKTKVTPNPVVPQPATGVTASDTSSDGDEAEKQISETRAREIAQKRVPGEVISVSKDEKSGKIVYVVEINANADNGSDTRVIIDAYTGEIVATEN